MRRQVDHASWLASSACQQGNGAFTREQWDWALSVRAAVPPSAALSCMVLRCLMPMFDACSYGRGCAVMALLPLPWLTAALRTSFQAASRPRPVLLRLSNPSTTNSPARWFTPGPLVHPEAAALAVLAFACWCRSWIW